MDVILLVFSKVKYNTDLLEGLEKRQKALSPNKTGAWCFKNYLYCVLQTLKINGSAINQNSCHKMENNYIFVSFETLGLALDRDNSLTLIRKRRLLKIKKLVFF